MNEADFIDIGKDFVFDNVEDALLTKQLSCGSHPLKGTCQEKRVSLYEKEVNFLPPSHVG